MPATFQGGQLMPAAGTDAYKAAQQASGAGNYNAQTGVLNVNNLPVYSPPSSTKTAVQPVVTSKAASDDAAQKLAVWQSLQAQVKDQQSAIAQKAAQQAADQAQKDFNDAEAKVKQTELGQKQQEIDVKNKALDVASKEDGGSTNKLPEGWDQQTYNNFKAANPNLEPTAEDTARMKNAGLSTGDRINQATSDFTEGTGAIQEAKDTLASKVSSSLQSILAGTFPLSAPQQALITSLQNQLSQNKQYQTIANSSYTGAVTEAAFRSGGEYTPAEMAGRIQSAISTGVAKIQELDNSAAMTMVKLENEFQQENYELINKNYEILMDKLDGKAKALQDTYKAVTDTFKDQRDQEIKFEQDVSKIAQDAAKNGAPKEVLDAISSSQSLGDAVATAGSYLQTGTGIVGEYQYYKREAEARGQTPMTFNEYQDEDANRKRLAATVAGDNGLTPAQTQNFIRISDKFQADQIMQAANTAKNTIAIADRVIANPNDASGQLSLLYTFVKSLDPNTAVREGEIGLATQTQSYLNRFATSIERIGKGQVISSEAAKDIAAETKKLAQAWNESGRRRESQYKSQAEVAGVGDAFKNYLGQYDRPYDTAIQNEEQSKTSVLEYGDSHPEVRDQIRSLSVEISPETGKPLTYQEIAQVIGVGNQVKSYSENAKAIDEIKINIPEFAHLASVNNNPGNLRFAGQTGAVKGEKGFAKFNSPEEGFKALINQVALDGERGLTLDKFINKYAPPGENDTKGYIEKLIKELGVTKDTKISKIDTVRLAKAIAQVESSSTFL